GRSRPNAASCQGNAPTSTREVVRRFATAATWVDKSHLQVEGWRRADWLAESCGASGSAGSRAGDQAGDARRHGRARDGAASRGAGARAGQARLGWEVGKGA